MGTIEEGWREKQRQRSLRLFGGQIFVQFLAALSVLPRSVLKKRLNSSYSSKSTEAKQLARQGIEQNLPPEQTRRHLPLLLSPSFFYNGNSQKLTNFIYFIVNLCMVRTGGHKISWHCISKMIRVPTNIL